MATRTALPGTSTNGTVWSEADINSLPGGWIGYLEVTATQSGISSITDLSGLSITVTVNSNRYIRVTGHITVLQNTGGAAAKARIREGSTTLQMFMDDSLATGERRTKEGSVILTPTAGSHTYKLSLETGANTIDMVAASADPGPAFILVEDIGST